MVFIVSLRIGIQGGLGTGKTALSVWYAYKRFLQGETIYSNVRLTGELKDFIPIRSLDEIDEIRGPAVLLMDELWQYVWSRKMGDSLSDMLIQLLQNSRKRNYTLVYTQQVDTLTDRIIREVTDLWMFPRPSYRIGVDKYGMPLYQKIFFDVIRNEGMNNYVPHGRTKWFNLLFIGSMYDTSEELVNTISGYDVVKRRIRELYDHRAGKHADFWRLSDQSSREGYLELEFGYYSRNVRRMMLKFIDANILLNVVNM